MSSGAVTSASGPIQLFPGSNPASTSGSVTVGAGTTIATGGTGSLAVLPSLAAAGPATDNINISGKLASGIGGVTILGGANAINTTLGISGTIASGAGITIVSGGTAGVDVYNIGGSLAATGNTSITASGPAILTFNGTVTSGGTTAINGGTTNNTVLNLNGTVNSTGN